MDLPPTKTFATLKAAGVKHLHHANSVITSCQFLRRGALLSRGSIERHKLYQTAQKSDEDDQKFGLWYDVFTDSVDIHQRASQANLYGPVLFVLDLAVVEAENEGRIWITKTNPIYWAKKKRAERWFASTEEVKSTFTYGSFGQMIVFRHGGGEIPIRKSLKKIILDDPKVKAGELDYWSMAYGALKLSMAEGRIDVPIIKRVCAASCKCRGMYSQNLTRTTKMYLPKVEGIVAQA